MVLQCIPCMYQQNNLTTLRVFPLGALLDLLQLIILFINGRGRYEQALELSDNLWAEIEPLPPIHKTNHVGVNHFRTVN